jgi:disulfide bond formation protein DsbB
MNIKILKNYLIHFIFLISAAGLVGSLYFSEIAKLPPCALCWYQRIFMYPIAFISAVGLFRKDKNSIFYIAPLSIFGMIISLYHNLIYYSIIPEAIKPCTISVPCTTRQLDLLGFISIPLMTLTAFVLINISLFLYYKLNFKKK